MSGVYVSVECDVCVVRCVLLPVGAFFWVGKGYIFGWGRGYLGRSPTIRQPLVGLTVFT